MVGEGGSTQDNQGETDLAAPRANQVEIWGLQWPN